MLNILGQLSNIKERLRELGPIPSIEKDILLEKLRELYVTAAVIGIREDVNGPEPFELEGEEIPDRQEDKENREVMAGKQENGEPRHQEAETGGEEETATGNHQGEPGEAPTRVTARPGNEGEPAGEKKTKPAGGTTLAEKYQGGKNYINEQLARDKEKGDLSAKLQSKPIGDIAGAIGINDKYKLIRDLFSGNPEVFEKTVTELNRATNFNEAFKYLNANFDWEMEDESVQLLLDLVRRKFIVDKHG